MEYIILDSEQEKDDYHNDSVEYMEREIHNLVRQNFKGVKILAVADVGRWDGRRSGYAEIDVCRQSLINGNYDSVKFFVDTENRNRYLNNGEPQLQSELRHHDGTHYVTYFLIKPEKEDSKAYAEILESLADNTAFMSEAHSKRFTELLSKVTYKSFGKKLLDGNF